VPGSRVRSRLPATLGLLGVLGLGACAEGPPARGPDRGADKARLFGDPGLVPTREGERARRELALAGQIRRALVDLSDVESASVDVELASPPTRVLVALAASTTEDERLARLEHYANEAASAVVGEPAEVTVLIDASPAPEPVGGGAPPLPLALALLGLGVSGGIAVERWRSRART
jgi:hypothetical protein